MKVIILNGPPGSGKDAVGGALNTKLTWDFGFKSDVIKFATGLKEALSSIFYLVDDEYKTFFESKEKDKPQERFFGRVPREILISLSEDWAKKQFGAGIFGKTLGKYIKYENELFFNDPYDFIVITDCGFNEELEGFFEWVSPEDCYLYNLHRDGTSFKNDSRNYVKSDKVLLNKDLHNNGTIEDVLKEILQDLNLNAQL